MIVSPDELEHGIRVATLGSKGQPMPGISSSPQPFCDSRNRLWSVRVEFHENAINAECGVRVEFEGSCQQLVDGEYVELYLSEATITEAMRAVPEVA